MTVASAINTEKDKEGQTQQPQMMLPTALTVMNGDSHTLPWPTGTSRVLPALTRERLRSGTGPLVCEWQHRPHYLHSGSRGPRSTSSSPFRTGRPEPGQPPATWTALCLRTLPHQRGAPEALPCSSGVFPPISQQKQHRRWRCSAHLRKGTS